MSGINTGILTNAQPLSTEQIKALEKETLNEQKSFVYLDQNSELCFSLPHGIDMIKELAWNNAYELSTEAEGFIKKIYKKDGLDSFYLYKVLQKANLEDSWIEHDSSVMSLEGDGQTFYTLAPSELSFRSTEPLSDFQEVRINGTVIDPSHYTLTEGSTIVTLSVDYLHTLEQETYNIEVVSNNSAPSANFNVVEQTINDQFFYYDVPYMLVNDKGNLDFSTYLGGFAGILMREDNSLYLVVIDDGDLDPQISPFTYSVSNNVMTCSAGISGTISEDGTHIYVEGIGTFAKSTEVAVSDGEYFYVSIPDWDIFTGGPFVLDRTKESYNIPLTNFRGRQLPFKYSFNWCENLKQVEIPFGATQVGKFCFGGCKNLSKIVIPSSVTAIDRAAFNYCENLTNIIFNGTVSQWNAVIKHSSWPTSCPATYVQCSDGQVATK